MDFDYNVCYEECKYRKDGVCAESGLEWLIGAHCPYYIGKPLRADEKLEVSDYRGGL